MSRALMGLIAAVAIGCASKATFEGVAARAPAPEVMEPPLNAAAGAGQGQPAPQRRIIYTATLELLVENFEAARDELLRLVEAHGGFVAGSELGGSPGAPRSGHWTLRVPVAKFQPFVTAATQLGETLRHKTDSQDVTDEFVDLEARLKNKRVEEERLQEHLRKSTGNLKDILEVERELMRVRGEIEQAQGRLQKLTNLTELTTVTVTLRERRDYVPPKAPAFGTTVGRTFGDSLDALVEFGKGLVLVVVAVAPWLPVLALAGGAVWLVARRWRGLRREAALRAGR